MPDTPASVLKGGAQREDDEDDESNWPNLFPEDDDSLIEDSPEAALPHEDDEVDDNARKNRVEADAEAPQEAEGEAGAADSVGEGLVEIAYHWESVPSDGAIAANFLSGALTLCIDLEYGVAWTQAVVMVALIGAFTSCIPQSDDCASQSTLYTWRTRVGALRQSPPHHHRTKPPIHHVANLMPDRLHRP